jgi:flagellar basal-body rod protein FlgB
MDEVCMFHSVSYVALGGALDCLAVRQRAIADNVANLNTPGYLAKRVLFEDRLAGEVSKASAGRESRESFQKSAGATTATVARSLEPTRLDGNNVNLDHETLANVDTNLRYELATQAMSAQYACIRIALGST